METMLIIMENSGPLLSRSQIQQIHVKSGQWAGTTGFRHVVLSKVPHVSVLCLCATEHILKALNSLQSSEEKLAALCKKYTELLDEHRVLQNKTKKSERQLTMVCHSPWYVTHHGMSLTMVCHSPWYVTHHGMSLTMVCHSPCYVTHHAMSLTMVCHSPWYVTHHGMSLTMVCHSPWYVTSPADGSISCTVLLFLSCHVATRLQ